MTIENLDKFRLYWVCTETGKKLPAGVAFYNEQQSDFRLKIDALPDDKLIFLRPTGTADGSCQYRVETVVKKNGKSAHRATIGTGYSRSQTGMPVVMDIGPYNKALLMEEE